METSRTKKIINLQVVVESTVDRDVVVAGMVDVLEDQSDYDWEVVSATPF